MGYKLKGNQVDGKIIGNLIFDERGKRIHKLHNREFIGIDHIEDKYSYEPGEPIRFSNPLRAFSYDRIMRRECKDMHLLDFFEVVKYWSFIPEKVKTYGDTASLAVFPKEGSNEGLRRELLKRVIKKRKITNPYIVSGLGIEKTTNHPSFRIIKTTYTTATRAPFLKQCGKIKYDPSKKGNDPLKGITSSDNASGINIYTAEDQSGVCLIHRDGLDLVAWYSDLLHLVEKNGRIQVIQNLESLLK